jgi:predicted RNase H-like nuclease (RuvC/YqgF family)
LESALKTSAIQENHGIRVLEDELASLRKQVVDKEDKSEKIIADQGMHAAQLVETLSATRSRVQALENELGCLADVEEESVNLVYTFRLTFLEIEPRRD